MSLTRFAPNTVVDASDNPPTEVNMASRKALGLIEGGPCQLNTGDCRYLAALNDTVTASRMSESGRWRMLSKVWPTYEQQ